MQDWNHVAIMARIRSGLNKTCAFSRFYNDLINRQFGIQFRSCGPASGTYATESLQSISVLPLPPRSSARESGISSVGPAVLRDVALEHHESTSPVLLHTPSLSGRAVQSKSLPHPQDLRLPRGGGSLTQDPPPMQHDHDENKEDEDDAEHGDQRDAELVLTQASPVLVVGVGGAFDERHAWIVGDCHGGKR